MYGLPQGNGHEARRLKHERFSNLSFHSNIANVELRAANYSLSPILIRETHEVSVRQKNTSMYSGQHLRDSFHNRSSNDRQHVCVFATVWRVLRKEGFQLFHLQRSSKDDCRHHVDFVRWMMHMVTNNSQFLSLILFTVEISFTIKLFTLVLLQ